MSCAGAGHQIGLGDMHLVRGVPAPQVASVLRVTAVMMGGRGWWWEAPDPSTKTAKREVVLLSAGDMEKPVSMAWTASTQRRERVWRRGDEHRLLRTEAAMEGAAVRVACMQIAWCTVHTFSSSGGLSKRE